MSKSCNKKSRRIPRCAGLGCRKSGLRHFFEVFIAPLRLRRGQGAMQGNPCYARLFADLTHTPQGAFSCPFGTIHLVPPNPIKASGGRSRAPPVARGARRKPSEQGSARKTPRADAARPLRTALRPPNPRGFFDRLGIALFGRSYYFSEVVSFILAASRTVRFARWNCSKDPAIPHTLLQSWHPRSCPRPHIRPHGVFRLNVRSHR